jgi:hypothetical protein
LLLTWPTPNLTLLNNALEQTAWPSPPLTETSWRQAVRTRLQEANWSRAAADVHPFLETGDAASLLTPDNLDRVLG